MFRFCSFPVFGAPAWRGGCSPGHEATALAFCILVVGLPWRRALEAVHRHPVADPFSCEGANWMQALEPRWDVIELAALER